MAVGSIYYLLMASLLSFAISFISESLVFLLECGLIILRESLSLFGFLLWTAVATAIQISVALLSAAARLAVDGLSWLLPSLLVQRITPITLGLR